jgi:hypothetical protein
MKLSYDSKLAKIHTRYLLNTSLECLLHHPDQWLCLIKHVERRVHSARFEIMVVKIQVEVSWVVMLCSVVVGYQCFGGLYRWCTLIVICPIFV